jgi:hypothetical protein
VGLNACWHKARVGLEGGMRCCVLTNIKHGIAGSKKMLHATQHNSQGGIGEWDR